MPTHTHTHQLLKTLQNNDDFIIVASDKNLGPCIIEREMYIERFLEEHLSDITTYRDKWK